MIGFMIKGWARRRWSEIGIGDSVNDSGAMALAVAPDLTKRFIELTVSILYDKKICYLSSP